ncbi:MAG: helix-turn-helix transcriptional regulator [Draconibacterium sp.]|nr:helix-turn-helix transcriptional regulator [Draconibacterium sp.]
MHFFYSNIDADASESDLLNDFGFINDFGFEEYKDIRQKPLRLHYNEGIEICYVTKGRYNWIVGDKNYMLLPGDGFVTCPWQKHGSPREVVDLGEIYWVVIKPQCFLMNGKFKAGGWSRFKQEQNRKIGKVLSENADHKLGKAQVLKKLFIALHIELSEKDFGYELRIKSLVEDFLIQTVRLIENRKNEDIKNKNWFLELNSVLINDLSRKWIIKELADLNNVGITTLTYLVKRNTGYTPANYIIFLRLEKAKLLLSKTSETLTEIAYGCGFYSSQHFSSTFSKWEGVSPLAFRRKSK